MIVYLNNIVVYSESRSISKPLTENLDGTPVLWLDVATEKCSFGVIKINLRPVRNGGGGCTKIKCFIILFVINNNA